MGPLSCVPSNVDSLGRKSPAQPDEGEVLAKGKGVAARGRLKGSPEPDEPRRGVRGGNAHVDRTVDFGAGWGDRLRGGGGAGPQASRRGSGGVGWWGRGLRGDQGPRGRPGPGRCLGGASVPRGRGSPAARTPDAATAPGVLPAEGRGLVAPGVRCSARNPDWLRGGGLVDVLQVTDVAEFAGIRRARRSALIRRRRAR